MILWHNPRCSKSRQALKLLEEAGHRPKLRLYLLDPPSTQELLDVLTKLGMVASQLVRKGEKTFKDLGLADADEQTLLTAMVQNPTLIERPIFINGDRAVVGRPPEDVLRFA